MFPNESAGSSLDYWPLRASARLVVPQDGLYRIGLRAGGLGALRVKGGTLIGMMPGPQSSKDVHQQADAFDFNGQADISGDPEIVTFWELKKGEYDMDVFLAKNIGPASLVVYSCPEGPYPPALISAGGARISEDVPGLPHAAP